MQTRGRELFANVSVEGAILPPDLLRRVLDGDKGLDGLAPDAYHLSGEKLGEAVSRSWVKLKAAWSAFAAAREKLPASDAGTTVTREKWLLPLFQELGYGRLAVVKAAEVGGKTYDISHGWQSVPIHLVTFRADLNRRGAVTGAQRASPHGLVQEYLNRSAAHLWGFVSNGLQLRILRDNASLTRQAFVEFDLAAIMQGEAYSDFALLWLLCHQSRVEADRPEDFWLEKWSRAAQADGTRVLDALRRGVERAIVALGAGFLAHPTNGSIRDALRSGALPAQDYYRQLLRLVYRILFLFVAEDRDLLLLPSADEAARSRFRHYSTRRLRVLASRVPGTPHADNWAALRLVMDRLGDDRGCPELGLPALGSFLWSRDALGPLATAEIANRHVLDAVRALSFADDGRSRRWVDYKNLGAEEFGSVYESLLELVPTIDTGTAAFSLTTASGNERKTTGSYYTPSSLVSCLLDSALDPVLDAASGKPDAEKTILALRVVDPACGSGHFLIAAAHRIARRLAVVRAGTDEPAPPDVRHALRDVIGHCIYGVDINPMAVELCKVALWMEALEPGRPLSFLESKIRCGNALIGAVPSLIARGIPDEAFDPIEGDDSKVASAWKRRNRAEREGQTDMFGGGAILAAPEHLADAVERAEALPEDSVVDVQRKAEVRSAADATEEAQRARLVADAWCAAFVQRKVGEQAITTETLRRLSSPSATLAFAQKDEVARLAEQYRFFHWHLAFPQVLRRHGAPGAMGWSGGFDVVLGNPPWERVKLQEKEWFATERPDIAAASNATARKKLIEGLRQKDPAMFAAFNDARREAEGESQFLRKSSRYPLCGKGDVNTYAAFCEWERALLQERGRVGLVVPAGIASDDTAKEFFQDIIGSRALVSLYSFENEEGLFPGVHHAMKFSLLTITSPGAGPEAAAFVFFARQALEVAEPERQVLLSAADIVLLNPNTQTCPVLRTNKDALLAKDIYRRFPVLLNEATGHNAWGVKLSTMFHMTNDAGLFRERGDLEQVGFRLRGNLFTSEEGTFLPLYEAKMIECLDHRAAGVRIDTKVVARQGVPEPSLPSDLEKAEFLPLPRYWVDSHEVEGVLAGKWERSWLFGWRDITTATTEKAVICAFMPRVAFGNQLFLMLSSRPPPAVACLGANIASLPFDYLARQKIAGLHLNFFTMKQLPVIPPDVFDRDLPWGGRGETAATWCGRRVLELSYTAIDMAGFARDLNYSGPPFRWEEPRRAVIRAELDAAFFHLYGLSRDDTEYVIDTLYVLRKNEEKAHGEFRTKRLVLERFDAMADAQRSGTTFQTPLDPPPAEFRIPRAERRAARQVGATRVDLAALADSAWATPPQVGQDNVALFALLDILRAFGGPMDANHVRLAALLVRKPALACPFMKEDPRAQWMRVIGGEARPLPTNVVSLTQLQRGGVDRIWAEALKHVKGSGHLVQHKATGKWSAGPQLLGSGQSWIEGRAAIVAELLGEIELADAEQNLVAFLKGVQHGAATKAIP